MIAVTIHCSAVAPPPPPSSNSQRYRHASSSFYYIALFIQNPADKRKKKAELQNVSRFSNFSLPSFELLCVTQHVEDFDILQLTHDTYVRYIL